MEIEGGERMNTSFCRFPNPRSKEILSFMRGYFGKIQNWKCVLLTMVSMRSLHVGRRKLSTLILFNSEHKH